jgi:hypothetical protein
MRGRCGIRLEYLDPRPPEHVGKPGIVPVFAVGDLKARLESSRPSLAVANHLETNPRPTTDETQDEVIHKQPRWIVRSAAQRHLSTCLAFDSESATSEPVDTDLNDMSASWHVQSKTTTFADLAHSAAVNNDGVVPERIAVVTRGALDDQCAARALGDDRG